MESGNGSYRLITILPLDYSCVGDHNVWSNTTCNDLNPTEVTKRNVIAGIRATISFLSVIGSLSIIIYVLCRKQYKSMKILPLFVLSIADFLLSLSWIIGGIMWWTQIHSREWCLVPSLLTVILVCVSANLTVVYSCVSYSFLKNSSIHTLLRNENTSHEGLSAPLTGIAYGVAWVLPLFLVLIPFGTLSGIFQVLHDIDSCSCWCLPFFANILPQTHPINMGTMRYFTNVKKLVVSFGLIVGTNYLVVFILLVYMYSKILKRIRELKALNRDYSAHRQYNYGSINTLIFKSQYQAKVRIIIFLLVFIFTGLANLILSYTIAINELRDIMERVKISEGSYQDSIKPFGMAVYTIQSLTAPLQGFLNALVYGWTREEFLNNIHKRKNRRPISVVEESDVQQLSYSGSQDVTSPGLH